MGKQILVYPESKTPLVLLPCPFQPSLLSFIILSSPFFMILHQPTGQLSIWNPQLRPRQVTFLHPPTLYYRCSRITLKSVATWPYELLLPVHLHPLGIDTEIREPLGLPFNGLSHHSFVTLTLYQGPHSCHIWIGPRMGNSNQRIPNQQRLHYLPTDIYTKIILQFKDLNSRYTKKTTNMNNKNNTLPA